MLELWVRNKSPAVSYKSLGVGLLAGICFLVSFGASQRLGALEGFTSLGTGGESFLVPTAPFELFGMDLLGSRGDWQPP